MQQDTHQNDYIYQKLDSKMYAEFIYQNTKAVWTCLCQYSQLISFKWISLSMLGDFVVLLNTHASHSLIRASTDSAWTNVLDFHQISLNVYLRVQCGQHPLKQLLEQRERDTEYEGKNIDEEHMHNRTENVEFSREEWCLCLKMPTNAAPSL